MKQVINKKFLEEVINLHKNAIFPLWDKLGRTYSVEGVREFLKEIFKKEKVIGYFIKDKLVGVIGITLEKRNLNVDFLLVDSNFQGKGIGKDLMSYVEESYKDKAEKSQLQVLEKNPAVNFYKTLGYKIISKSKNKLTMEKILK
jgi:ribosomal protein S18 acetylase RimI-like enzyme